MNFLSQTAADLFVPENQTIESALATTTHLGIGAHQDDLEFMALHGILECFQSSLDGFGGVTCTDGAGSARTGAYAEFTDEQMKAIRTKEQKAAARIGQYRFVAQLGHPSQHAKDPQKRQSLTEDIYGILTRCKPKIVYTHNPFDKHATHVGVLFATLDAIRRLAPEDRPDQLLGCEVWRGLDWLPDSLKVVQDVSAHPDLAAALNGVFKSQIGGGKRYDLAVQGRHRANATFFDSQAIDQSGSVAYAVDLNALMRPDITMEAFIEKHLLAFCNDVRATCAAVG